MNANKLLILLVVGALIVGIGAVTYKNSKAVEPAYSYTVSVDKYNDLVYRYNTLAESYNLEIKKPKQNPVLITENIPIYVYTNEARHFKDLNELKDWLELDDTNKHEYIKGYYNCQNFARDLQLSAIESGYIISTELSEDRHHMLNTAYLSVVHCRYYIEPQTDEVWLMGVMIP